MICGGILCYVSSWKDYLTWPAKRCRFQSIVDKMRFCKRREEIFVKVWGQNLVKGYYVPGIPPVMPSQPFLPIGGPRNDQASHLLQRFYFLHPQREFSGQRQGITSKNTQSREFWPINVFGFFFLFISTSWVINLYSWRDNDELG